MDVSPDAKACKLCSHIKTLLKAVPEYRVIYFNRHPIKLFKWHRVRCSRLLLNKAVSLLLLNKNLITKHRQTNTPHILTLIQELNQHKAGTILVLC